jgi:hypothetical protein
MASVLQCAKYCRQLFDIMIENERKLSMARKTKKSNGVEISFLKKKNNTFVIEKHIC